VYEGRGLAASALPPLALIHPSAWKGPYSITYANPVLRPSYGVRKGAGCLLQTEWRSLW
jgi:hypothetical protein